MIQPPDQTDKPTKRDAKGARRRHDILKVAARIFHEKGYDATSTKDIADAAGLLKGSLYYYVETKEDFLFEIIKENYDGAIATLDGVRQIEGPPLERLARLIGEHFRYFVDNLITTTVFFREFRVLSPDRRAVIAAEGDEYLDFVRELLLQGQREGSIAPELDIRIVSLGIVGMVNSAWLWYQPGGSRTTDEIAAEFVKMIVSGIASDGELTDAGSAAQLRTSIAAHSIAVPRETVPDQVEAVAPTKRARRASSKAAVADAASPVQRAAKAGSSSRRPNAKR